MPNQQEMTLPAAGLRDLQNPADFSPGVVARPMV
jgi:hypothetical protein